MNAAGRVIVTGASGGFGREFARRLEARGHALLLHGRDERRLGALRDSLRHPARHCMVLADLATGEGCEALIRQATAMPVTGLVNNAGFGRWGAFSDVAARDHASVLTADLLAPVRLAHALWPHIAEQRGFIINVSSLAGESPMPYLSSYGAAKAGLTAWSEALRAEARGRVTIVTLIPGPSPTGFRAVSGMPEKTGDFFREPPSRVVDCALRMLDRGGGCRAPGARHKLLHLLQTLTPRALAARLAARAFRP